MAPSSGIQDLSKKIVNELRIGLSLCRFHHLTDEETQGCLLSTSILLVGFLISRNDLSDDFFDRSRVGDLFQSLLCDHVLGRLPLTKHHFKHILGHLTRDFAIFNEPYEVSNSSGLDG